MFTEIAFKAEIGYISGKKVDDLVPGGIIVLYISAPWRKQKLTIFIICRKGTLFCVMCSITYDLLVKKEEK